MQTTREYMKLDELGLPYSLGSILTATTLEGALKLGNFSLSFCVHCSMLGYGDDDVDQKLTM